MSTEPPHGADMPAENVPSTEVEEPDELAVRLCRALVCAAVDPALSGVLLFDLEPQLLDPVARLFARILTGDPHSPGPPVMLSAASRDEDLWTRPVLQREDGGISFRMEPGPLIETDGRSGPPSLVVVPDLTRLSVAGMRAAVQLLGADVTVVEYGGLSHRARPRARWLAACRSADAGRPTGHLLDRFALRLPTCGLRLPTADHLLGMLPPSWLDIARDAQEALVPTAAVSDEALDRVHELLGPESNMRRELSLARLARALATLDGEGTATSEHCAAAARLMGLAVAEGAGRAEPTGGASGSASRSPHPSNRPSEGMGERRHTGQDIPGAAETGQPLLETEPAEGVGAGRGGVQTVLATPYPEDEAEALRDFAPLRSPWQRTAGSASLRGVVIGTRRATDLSDIAHVRTVREAAVHQRIRRTEQFTVSPVDLHSHVRASSPEHMLVLLLDHTCRGGDWDWQDTLTPFLEWAYTRRAAVHIIEVGSAETGNELRAESFAARSVLDPRILPALYRPVGRASPLADGVEQAVQALRRSFRQHGNSLTEAWLVVVTDGRGNVPLRASRTGRLRSPVGTEGVEDTLKAAAGVSAMDRTRLRVAVIDAGREPYGSLPFSLAEALGGVVLEGPSARVRTRGGGGAGER
ncbi:Mg-chelatase subunit ChlD [Streptomyces lincolnensis]|uniref:Mg-chelatase subunit ChlD n=2 Tax=Streptomyces lincolnensis TaxID=1915 RepID=A0A1B1MH10_STRLN|nr:Mg-chelatase subunit ChlD [Streptomyces lincolnensis]AXG53890.1 Mg-chelatase subunit ChlD [Streptomyces lincolnensis]